jgi:hypothetical protein
MYPAVELPTPTSKQWIFREDFKELPGGKMLEFRLVYQGLLHGEDDSKHKHAIRQYFHKQLVKLWQVKHPLKPRGESAFQTDTDGSIVNKTGIEMVAADYQNKFVPIVTSKLALTCSLDMLILRPDHFPIIKSGDLDNRVKTMLDALRIPKVNEYQDGDENPLYCLLEDDKLVAELRVTADLLMAPPEQIVENPKINKFGEETVRINHALAMIHVVVKPTRVMRGNLDYV